MTKILILPYRIDQSINDLEYLSEGIFEELTQLISSKSTITTTSRSTSMYLLNNPKATIEIKNTYAIDYFVEGRIKKKQGVYYISTHLFKTTNEELVLNESVVFDMDKWTTPLNAIANNIIKVINGKNLDLEETQTDNTKAREYYLRGIYHWHRYTHSEMLLSIKFFKKSIKENKSFALSHAALADSYSVIGAMAYEEPIQAFKLAQTYVNNALLLNNKRSDSYVSAAFVNIYYNRNFPQAKVNLEQALKLNINNVKAHHVFAMYYIHKGDFIQAEKHSAITIKLEPLALQYDNSDSNLFKKISTCARLYK